MLKKNQVWELRSNLFYKWKNIEAKDQGQTSSLQYAEKAFKILNLDSNYVYISWIKGEFGGAKQETYDIKIFNSLLLKGLLRFLYKIKIIKSRKIIPKNRMSLSLGINGKPKSDKLNTSLPKLFNAKNNKYGLAAWGSDILQNFATQKLIPMFKDVQIERSSVQPQQQNCSVSVYTYFSNNAAYTWTGFTFIPTGNS